jgi:xanthine dehydrogenase YagR molybdenum-binding subunit
VANAIGIRVTSLPITPDKVLAALGKVPSHQTTSDSNSLKAAFVAVENAPEVNNSEALPS